MDATAERLRSGVVEDSLADVRAIILLMLLVLTAWTAVPAIGALAFGLWLRRELEPAGTLTARSCRRAERAAWRPAMPWTPPPGGTDDEHRYRPGPDAIRVERRPRPEERAGACSSIPPLMSPPT